MTVSLREFLDGVAERRKRVTVFAPERYDALESHFETRNVTVEQEDIPDDGSGGFVVVTEGGEFVGSVDAAAIRTLVSPTAADAKSAPSEAMRALLDLLADTTFVSFDKGQLVVMAHEIEDRAFRQGRGTLRTGFQALQALKAQRDVYETLAAKSDLDVHVYGERDWSPDVSGVTIHAVDGESGEESDTADPTTEIGAYWFVVFDGGGDDRQACALLAEEDPPDSGRFRGFWTYDAELVGDIDAYLRETYG